MERLSCIASQYLTINTKGMNTMRNVDIYEYTPINDDRYTAIISPLNMYDCNAPALHQIIKEYGIVDTTILVDYALKTGYTQWRFCELTIDSQSNVVTQSYVNPSQSIVSFADLVLRYTTKPKASLWASRTDTIG